LLYASTRDDRDAFTSARALGADFAPDGGLFVPFRLPVFSPKEIRGILELSFGDAVAEVINQFFSCRFSGWDVDFAVGRQPAKLYRMNHRLILAELWHNPGEAYAYIEEKLFERLRTGEDRRMPTEWASVAVRVSILFGIFALMQKENNGAMPPQVDVALSADDFSLPMAAWYGRKMGLPIGTIACGCNVGSGLWDLLNRGELVASANAAAPGYERLIREVFGAAECRRYVSCLDRGRVYSLGDEERSELSRGVYAAVVGKDRIRSLIHAVNKSTGYRLEKDTALAYGALQDYRAGTGEGRSSLILVDRKPAATL